MKFYNTYNRAKIILCEAGSHCHAARRAHGKCTREQKRVDDTYVRVSVSPFHPAAHTAALDVQAMNKIRASYAAPRDARTILQKLTRK